MIGATLGPYRIDAELGSGGMGRVWRATVTRPAAGLEAGAVVALKAVHPQLLEEPGFFKRFLREAHIGKAVVHENVVRTFDADAIGVAGVQHHFIVMEYVEGQTLRALANEMRVPEELCRHIGFEVAKGLAAIHAAGAVHRDMKPENVLITREHVVKVMDFGVARIADDQLRLSQSGAFVGSIQYAAPEQFRNTAGVDARADLHALGLILYELSTGQHPYRADDFCGVLRRVLDDKPRRPAEINPQLSPFFEEMVLKLLAKDRDQRFASAAELAQVLEDGERSAWWGDRARAIRAQTMRPLRRIRIPRETALYGREAELALLRARFASASEGDGRAVLVEGEAGIGKSRLVDEFVGLLVREGQELNFLFGSYPPGGAATASGAFSTAYREQFGDADLDETLRKYLPVTPILVPAFAALLRGETTPPGVEPLTKDSLHTVFVHATRSLARERTTIVLIDDLHFAPDEGRALFAALAMAVAGHRILLIGTTRPGVDGAWLGGLDRAGVARLALPRLSPKDLARLLVEAFHSERLAEQLSGKIATKSDGNPYFVFEILKMLREGPARPSPGGSRAVPVHGFITKNEDGAWVSTRVIDDIQIPSSVLDLVNARVSVLVPEERDLLDIAACLGFEFDPLVVGEVAGLAPIPLLKRLAQIERAHRLVRAAGQRYVFDHHQVQEALYGSLPDMLRAEYHAALAEALAARAGAASADPKTLDGALCVELAGHWLRGSQGGKALRYLNSALTHLEKGYFNDAAIQLAGRALAVPNLVLGRARSELLLRKAERLDIVGRWHDQRAALDEALVLADAGGDAALRARVRRSLGVQLLRISKNDEAMARSREAQELARTAGDPRADAAAAKNLGNVFLALGRFAEALEQYERCLALALSSGDADGEAAATINMGIAFTCLGRFTEAQEHNERGCVLARRCGNRRWEANATGSLGNLALSLGRFQEAREHIERCHALAREIGDRRGEVFAAHLLGFAFVALGRLAEARGHFERALALAREIGDRRGEGYATGDLGDVSRHIGRNALAQELYERHLAIAREVGDPRAEGSVLHALAELASDEGDAATAERRFAEALDVRRTIGARDGVAETLCARGSLLTRLGRTEEARDALGAVLGIARELSLHRVELLATAGMAQLPGGDPAAALAALSAHERRVELQAAMEARFLLWRSTHDREHLVEATRLLDFMNAHAPEDCRESMLANVRLHRDIVAAAKDAGL